MTAATAGAPEGGGGRSREGSAQKARLFPYSWSGDAEPRLQVGRDR